jgi:hypothetical protein
MAETELEPDEVDEVKRLIGEWLVRCRVSLKAYNDATTRASAHSRWLGATAAGLSALVATAVFGSLKENPETWLQILTGLVAVLAGVLSALQTSLRSNERSEQFREAARGYGSLRRRLEQALLFPPKTREEATATLEELYKALADASRGKPNVPRAVWDRAEFKVKGTSDAHGLRARLLGIRRGAATPALLECHECYFSDLGAAEVVPLTSVRTSGSTPASVKEAGSRMREAAARRRDRRPPLDVRQEDDGTYTIIDGHATFAVAQESGWKTVPVRVVHVTR